MTNNGIVTRSSRPNIKAGWQYKSLISVSKVLTDGDWIESKDQASDGIRLIQTGNVGVGQFKDRVEKARYISEETFSRLRCEEVFQGDCLISRLPDPVGRACIIPEIGERMITAVDCSIVRLDHQIVLPEFFNYYAQSTEYLSAVASKCTGTTRNRISRANLGEIELAVPPIKEQDRIVAILDEAFEGIDRAKANTERSLIASQALFDALLANTYSGRGSHWRTETISNASKHNLGKMLDKVKNRGTLRPYLRNLNVRWFEFDLSDMKEMPFLPEESARYSIAKGDVVICEGGYPGRAAIWDGDDSIHFQKALHRVRFTNPLHSKWFVYYLYSQHRLGLLKPWFTGTGISHFTAEALARFELPVPPDNELKVIVQQFDDVRQMALDLEKLYRQKLVTIEELRQSLLERAFSGSL